MRESEKIILLCKEVLELMKNYAIAHPEVWDEGDRDSEILFT